MLRKIMTVLAMTVVAFAATAGVASAEPTPYPAPDVPGVDVDSQDQEVEPGEEFEFRGDHFLPGENIDIVDNGEGSGLRSGRALSIVAAARVAMTVQADASGAFAAPIALTKVGTHTLTATGLTSGRTSSVTIKVLGAGSAPAAAAGSAPAAAAAVGASGAGGGLAYTGTSVAGPLTIGAGALVAGLALLFFGSRLAIRRKHRTSVQ